MRGLSAVFDVFEIGSERPTAVLEIPLCPDGASLSLKNALCSEDWDVVRKFVYTRAGRSCQVCGDIGPEWPVAAEPLWVFDTSSVARSSYGRQRLVDVVALCPDCLSARNDAKAYVRGADDVCREETLSKFSSSHKLSFDNVFDMLEKARVQSVRMVDFSWALELSWLVTSGVFDVAPQLDLSVVTVIDGVIVGGL